MAFFKFRFPGPAAASSASAEAIAPGSGESIELVRRRARHRLIGAVVLVLMAVVGFPLLFDTQPRPVAVDTPILIPDRPSTSPLNVAQTLPSDAAPAKPLLPEPKALPAQAGLDVNEEPVQADPPAAVQPKPSAGKPEDRPATSKNDKLEPASVVKPKDDGNKARALLEGKPAAAVGERLVVQVGAFTDAAKVREVRRKLEQAGVSTFTQVVDGKDGKSTTRVRVGPFISREEADKAAVRIRKLDLAAVILRI